MDMKLIPMRTGFGYSAYWWQFHYGYRGCYRSSDFIECDKVLGYHYDTFGYIEIDHKAAIQKFSDKGKIWCC
jgi:hypothetical protein